uniref:BMRF1 n=1 Tax=Epstein-Barr virus (strain GD1) TaxID=10376 RepID=A0A2S1N1S9_EBVG|nr:BMRF1 [human gammaherpesvirus 4]AWG93080.1 BMRF1 [human gammaherpesvirus 4]AWG93140.1 BMRF1 [human gammaherpesvirus 4]AWG93263.1 BMRF1 [human gammaherpesvirus 4]AWG93323.1 BMRF1 [human gammaherpesvirus 4]
METTQTLRFKTKALAVLSKCYDHAQTHLKGGVLQVNLLSVNYGGPRLAAVANAGTAGLISFEVSPDAVAEWQNHQSPEEAPAAVSFRNLAYGRTCVLGKELFGSAVEQASLQFYKRPQGGSRPEFVKLTMEYDDKVSKSHHTCALMPYMPPASDRLRNEQMIGQVLLMPKTASSLQKWARQQGSGGVKVTLNPDLYVTTYTSGEACLTLDYKPLSVGPYEAFTGPVAKAQDAGAVEAHVVCSVAADSLAAALSLCRIPAVSVPILRFYRSGIIAVVAGLMTSAGDLPLDLSVILFNHASEEAAASTASEPEDKSPRVQLQGTGLQQRPRHTVSPSPSPPPPPRTPTWESPARPETPSPAIPSHSSNTALERPLAVQLARKRTSSEARQKQKHPKKVKQAFNPLI